MRSFHGIAYSTMTMMMIYTTNCFDISSFLRGVICLKKIYFMFLSESCLGWNSSHRLWPKPRPILRWPKPTSMAQASVWRGRSQEKLSLSHGFLAEPSWHITRDHRFWVMKRICFVLSQGVNLGISPCTTVDQGFGVCGFLQQ